MALQSSAPDAQNTTDKIIAVQNGVEDITNEIIAVQNGVGSRRSRRRPTRRNRRPRARNRQARQDHRRMEKRSPSADLSSTSTQPSRRPSVGAGISADPIHAGDNNDNRRIQNGNGILQNEDDHRSQFKGDQPGPPQEEQQKGKDGKKKNGLTKCVGIGISDCDPIHVGDNNDNRHDGGGGGGGDDSNREKSPIQPQNQLSTPRR